MAPAISPFQDGVRVTIHAQPGAKRTQLAGQHGEAIKIRVQSPPIEGRANEELLRFLAETLRVARSHVSLIRGDKSRSKVFEIRGVSEAEAIQALMTEK